MPFPAPPSLPIPVLTRVAPSASVLFLAPSAEVNMPNVGSWLVDSKGRFNHDMPPTVFYQMQVSSLRL